MEIRKVADALVRSHVSPLGGLLTSASSTRRCSASQLSSLSSCNTSRRRFITSTSRKDALPSSPTTTSSPNAPASTPPPNEAAPTSLLGSQDSLDGKSRNLWWTRGPPNQSNSPSFRSENSRSGAVGNTVKDILARLPPSRTDFSRMIDVPSVASPERALQLEQGISNMLVRQKSAPRKPIRFGPSTGRDVMVTERMKPDLAVNMVNRNCSRDKVRADFYAQRFHERPGLKRKRLKRAGWRKKFLEGFKATCDRARALARQGW